MKRGILVAVLLIFLLIPSAMAAISLKVPDQQDFNIGDRISVSGTVKESSDIDGFLQLSVVCNDEKFPLQLTPLTLKAGMEKSFPAEVNTPDIVALATMAGSCYVLASVTEDGSEIESARSDSFNIKKTLRGSFSIEEPRVQVGNEIRLRGIIQKLDGNPINGMAEVYFNKETRFLVDVVEIMGGELTRK